MTPFSYDVESFIDYMKEQGYSITKSQVNCWQRKAGSEKSRPVPDFVFTMIFNYIHNNKIEVAEFLKKIKRRKMHVVKRAFPLFF